MDKDYTTSSGEEKTLDTVQWEDRKGAGSNKTYGRKWLRIVSSG